MVGGGVHVGCGTEGASEADMKKEGLDLFFHVCFNGGPNIYCAGVAAGFTVPPSIWVMRFAMIPFTTSYGCAPSIG